MALAGLERRIAAQLDTPAPDAAAAIVREIRHRHGSAVAAILFYGSCRRTGDMTGLLDLYVLHDGHRAFHGGLLTALLNALLPPNVVLLSLPHEGGRVRAKVAILSRRQYARRMRSGSLDTTIWARFAQPASLLHARDASAREWVETTLAQGIRTAVLWAVRLGPQAATSAQYWRTLFARTYRMELRPERGDRPGLVYDNDAPWFDQILVLGLAELGLDPTVDTDGRLHPGLGRQPQWTVAWAIRRLWGKPLNVLRLVKASLTVEDGTDYLAWKIERHSGIRLVLTPWQRRHPVLAAPVLLWRLRRSGAIR